LGLEEAGEDEAAAGTDEVSQTVLKQVEDGGGEDVNEDKIGLIK